MLSNSKNVFILLSLLDKIQLKSYWQLLLTVVPQVLEYLATREILTLDHIIGGPHRPGVERWIKSCSSISCFIAIIWLWLFNWKYFHMFDIHAKFDSFWWGDQCFSNSNTFHPSLLGRNSFPTFFFSLIFLGWLLSNAVN